MLGIDKKDIEFLKELQHEMLTQDHVYQASPRFWVVRGTTKEWGIEPSESDGCILTDECYELNLETMKDCYEYIIENMEDREADLISGDAVTYDEENDVIYVLTGDGEIDTLSELEDILDYLDDNNLQICYFRNIEKNFENTMFLTNRECKAHIKSNYYHYPADAHSYAMTAWRSYEVDTLWKILDKINWDEVEKLI